MQRECAVPPYYLEVITNLRACFGDISATLVEDSKETDQCNKKYITSLVSNYRGRRRRED